MLWSTDTYFLFSSYSLIHTLPPFVYSLVPCSSLLLFPICPFYCPLCFLYLKAVPITHPRIAILALTHMFMTVDSILCACVPYTVYCSESSSFSLVLSMLYSCQSKTLLKLLSSLSIVNYPCSSQGSLNPWVTCTDTLNPQYHHWRMSHITRSNKNLTLEGQMQISW